jgi:hypothetical protein
MRVFKPPIKLVRFPASQNAPEAQCQFPYNSETRSDLFQLFNLELFLLN